ncbi:MAG: L-carnitine dehydrogenase [Deinococcales bacterium]
MKKTLGVVGTGVIGAGWAARALAQGLDVIASDPAPDAETKLRASIDNAWPALSKLGLMPNASRDRLHFTRDLAEVGAKASFIQESAPEREDLKIRLHHELDAVTPANIVIASSSSGLLPTRIQSQMVYPERLVIGHPFNPSYLLPLVEVLGGEKTAVVSIEGAKSFYKSLGMHPLHVRKEIEGYLSDRLQEALWREVLHLVNDGIASTQELDEAIIYGPGLRWAFMGTCLTFHLAGGDMGMRHMLAQFGPALKLPWTKLEAPELTETLIDRMVEGTQEQAKGISIKELEQLRDNCLIDIMRTLKAYNYASGQVMAEHETKLYQSYPHQRWQQGADIKGPLELYRCQVKPEWIDYNGHMTEASYLTAFGDASDALFRYIGIDEAYRASGQSFYTVESHINYYKEAKNGEKLSFKTQILGLDAKRLHLFHTMYLVGQEKPIATTEQMLLHVDSKAAKASLIQAKVYEALMAIYDRHQHLTSPSEMGRKMGLS